MHDRGSIKILTIYSQHDCRSVGNAATPTGLRTRGLDRHPDKANSRQITPTFRGHRDDCAFTAHSRQFTGCLIVRDQSFIA